jgi:hypothetical protein
MPGEQILSDRPLFGARLNLSHPLAQGLVGCWLLNEPGGLSAMDLSPYKSHGQLIGFSSPPKRDFPLLYFNGATSKIRIPYNSVFDISGGKFTLSVWYKVDVQQGNRLISKNETSDYAVIGSNTAPSDDLSLHINGGGRHTANDVLISGRLTYLNCTYNRFLSTLNARVFLDGKLNNGSNYTAAVHTSTEDLYIGGKGADDARDFSGWLANVMIHNRDLTAEEIRALYLSPYAPFGEELFI